MGRLISVAAALALLVAVAGCGSSSKAKNRPPPIDRTVLVEVARRAQEDMRRALHDKTMQVRGMQCRPASRTAYACGLQVVNRQRRPAVVIIYLRFDSTTNRGVMAFTDSSNRRWARVLVRR